MSAIVTFHLSISGLVQGVSYRWSMVREAQRLGLAGWVRNRRDGRVEALVQGERQVVEQLLDWARRGPPGARVDGVEVREEEHPPEEPFRQVATL